MRLLHLLIQQVANLSCNNSIHSDCDHPHQRASCHLVADCVPSVICCLPGKRRVRLGGQELPPTFPRWSANPTAFDIPVAQDQLPVSTSPSPSSTLSSAFRPPQSPSPRSGQRRIYTTSNMSSEQVIEQLRSHINSLESRVHELEGKYGKPDTSSKSAVDGMRMILIGPPGAGAYILPGAQWLRMRLTPP